MTYDQLKLEKGMYTVPGKNFTEVLEGLDPSANYHAKILLNYQHYGEQLRFIQPRQKSPPRSYKKYCCGKIERYV